jgi:hypothetical protein
VQLLKLAAVHSIPRLSEVYVIWDMDMIPTQRIPVLYLPSSQANNKIESNLHSMELQREVSIMTSTGQPVRTVVNIGGFWNRGYGESYENLLKKKCVSSPSPTSALFLPVARSRNNYHAVG